MSDYNTLYDKVVSTLSKYSMASIAAGIDIDQIHNMVLQHQDKLMACDTFEKGKAYASEVIYTMCGFACPIDYVITDEIDLRILYEVCVVWRNAVLHRQRSSL